MTQSRPNVQITFADVDDLPSLEPHMEVRATWWASAIALLVIAYLSFGPSLAGAFLPQDDVNVSENIFLRAAGGLRAIWRFCYSDLFQQFSPLGYSLYLLEYRIWGGLSRHASMGYREVSVLLHVANVLLLWTMLRKLDLRGAFVAAAIFAAHPVQVQTVAWISQQPMLLGTSFALCSMIVYLRFIGMNPPPYQPGRFGLPESRWMLYGIALLLFILAILAKPAMAVLPLIVLVMIWWERGKITAEDMKPLAAFLAIALITFIGAVVIFRRSTVIGEQQVGTLNRMLIVGPALWFFLLELVRTGTFSFVYGRWNPTAWWTFLVLCADVLVIASLWWMRRRIGRGPLAAAIIFVLLLLPQILFVDLHQSRESFVADSAMYLAIAALIVPLVERAAELLAPRGAPVSAASPAAWVSTACVLVAMGLSFWVSQSYASPERLWQTALVRSPNNVYVLNELGALELDKQRPMEAEAHFLKALAIDKENVETHRHLGAYFEANSRPDHAYAEYYLIVQKRPQDITARCGMARAMANQGDRLGAIVEYQRVLAIRPDYEVALNDMAMTYTELGLYDDAVRCYQRAIHAAPTYIASHINLASLYFRLGKYDDAANAINAAEVIDPTNFVIKINRGAFCGQLAQITNDAAQKKQLIQAAESAFRQALYLNHDSGVAAFNLGEVLAYEANHYPTEAGKMKEAVFYYIKAAQLEPDNQKYAQRLSEARLEVSKRG